MVLSGALPPALASWMPVVQLLLVGVVAVVNALTIWLLPSLLTLLTL